MNIVEAKQAIDKVIAKARVHLYKPIQIAEILHRDRTQTNIIEELAENIVSSVNADRIVIVCKQAEQKIILSLLNQIGWKSRIQSIITENDLTDWYEKALRGKYGGQIGEKMLQILSNEIKVEFPITENVEFVKFYKGRGYDRLTDPLWNK